MCLTPYNPIFNSKSQKDNGSCNPLLAAAVSLKCPQRALASAVDASMLRDHVPGGALGVAIGIFEVLPWGLQRPASLCFGASGERFRRIALEEADIES